MRKRRAGAKGHSLPWGYFGGVNGGSFVGWGGSNCGSLHLGLYLVTNMVFNAPLSPSSSIQGPFAGHVGGS